MENPVTTFLLMHQGRFVSSNQATRGRIVNKANRIHWLLDIRVPDYEIPISDIDFPFISSKYYYYLRIKVERIHVNTLVAFTNKAFSCNVIKKRKKLNYKRRKFLILPFFTSV